ncbi:MAG TPA: hypothetical protein VGF33_08895 [Caulobacteraceae bacterium]|jgi:uncharacterized protein YceK
MAIRLALALIIAGLLAGCSSLRCQESSRNSRAAGGCGLHSTF